MINGYAKFFWVCPVCNFKNELFAPAVPPDLPQSVNNSSGRYALSCQRDVSSEKCSEQFTIEWMIVHPASCIFKQPDKGIPPPADNPPPGEKGD